MQPPHRPSTDTIHAAIITRDGETRYRRRGAGRAVLLLATRPRRGPGVAALFEELSRHVRVFAPIPPRRRGGKGPPLAFAPWLRGVIDGLGLARPAVVAEGATGLRTLAFAMTDPERIDRLAIIVRDRTDSALPAAVAHDTLERSRHPLLVARWEMRENPSLTVDQIARIVGFLSEPVEPY